MEYISLLEEALARVQSKPDKVLVYQRPHLVGVQLWCLYVYFHRDVCVVHVPLLFLQVKFYHIYSSLFFNFKGEHYINKI